LQIRRQMQLKTCVHAFDTNLFTQLDDANFNIDLPNHVFYLQDNNFWTPLWQMIFLWMRIRGRLAALQIEADGVEFETCCKYIGAEFRVDWNGEESVPAKVTKQALDYDGRPIGERNVHLLFDTRKYECILDDGSVHRYNANVIAAEISSLNATRIQADNMQSSTR
jgi:hypothetical protein